MWDEADEDQRGEDLDDDAQVQGHLNEDGGQRVRQDVAEHDPQIRCAGRARRLDEHVRLHGQDLRADEPRVRGPPEDQKRQVQRREVPGDDVGHRDREDEERDRISDVRRAHEPFVEEAAFVPGDESDKHADDRAAEDDDARVVKVDADRLEDCHAEIDCSDCG